MIIDQFNETIRTCQKCQLCETRINAICGEGNPKADLVFIAQAPGQVEDREGRMFLGPSGRVFFELLGLAGMGREDFYMTNLVKCRLPKNRRPKRDEIEACSGYLDAEIAWVRPKLLVPLGYFATRHIFEKHALGWPPAGGDHGYFGTVYRSGEQTIYPLQHPAAMLYNPVFKEAMRENYRRLKVVLEACN